MPKKSCRMILAGAFCATLALVSCESTPTKGASSQAMAAYRAATSSAGTRWNGQILSRRVVRTTAYTHTEADHLQYGAKSAYGTQLRYGKVRSAAADWSRYPVGTVFRIKGLPFLYIVDDYGSALVGKDTIDLYTINKNEMGWWGARYVTVEVLRWGSLDLSYQLLANRTQYPHCLQMASTIRARRPSVASLSPLSGPVRRKS